MASHKTLKFVQVRLLGILHVYKFNVTVSVFSQFSAYLRLYTLFSGSSTITPKKLGSCVKSTNLQITLFISQFKHSVCFLCSIENKIWINVLYKSLHSVKFCYVSAYSDFTQRLQCLKLVMLPSGFP